MKNIKNITSRAIASPWFYPLALLFIGIIAYGLMLPRLGFYWDDWEGVYLYRLHDPAISFHYYAERPLSALVFLALFPFIKMTPVVMQALALLLRWGGVLFIYSMLNLVWPGRKGLHRWIGALLFVFPGFFDQQVAVAFTPHLATFLLFSASLFLTALALRDRRRFWLWMPLSILLGLTQIFMMEYFVVMELLRPLLIWFILRSEQANRKDASLKTFLYWLPFLAGLGVYLWWRLAYLPSTLPAADPNNPALLKSILHTPVEALFSLANKVFGDIRYLFIYIWANAFFNLAVSDLHAKVLWVAWFLGLLVAIFFGLYIRTSAEKDPANPEKSILQPALFGMVAFLAGGLPVWMTNRQVSLGKWSDRFSLAPMLGIVILLVYLIDWLFRTKKQKYWLQILLLGFSISAQIWNANSYRLDWGLQRDIYWQLAWRIPALKPGTAVIGKGTFTDKSSYYDATYIMNFLFAKNPAANPLYSYFDVFHLPPFEDGLYRPTLPISFITRSGQFSGNTSQAIGMYFNLSGGCVRILDQVYRGDPNLTNDINSNDRLDQLTAISNVDLIGAGGDPVSPDPALFGAEPPHGWCYYFEKADLARQQQNWQTVLQLGAQADAGGYKPVLGAEYLPFIEANARTGEWAKAFDLSLAAQKTTKDLEPSLCNNWTRLAEIQGGAGRDTTLAQAQSEFCK